MKNKYSKIGLIVFGLGLFTISMLVPSQKVEASMKPSECTWQEYSGNNYSYFCGYEANDLHCTCGDFC
ncbi:hypothetical protein [Draconibacterium orientale]|uniref:hypothetical protein n=1 Tax=Draconibacterium orientale TaxID=1168034 RepID=UPI0029C02BB8|nr:hypothetical protein [Draconibacterium orientale]